MKKSFFSFLIILLSSLFWFNGISGAYSYFGYTDYGGTWHDADKTLVNTEDDFMCWAAATSNVLAYTGWGFPQGEGFSNTDEIFSYFQDHWTQDQWVDADGNIDYEGGNIYYGVDWWFDGTNNTQGVSGWSQVDVAGGGGFYTSENVSDYYLHSSLDQFALSNLDYLLTNGYGVGLGLAGPSGHAVTAWGYDYDDSNNYSGVWITDSDDGVDSLQYYDILYSSNQWYLQDYSGWDDYYISEVYGLEIMAGNNAVPVPATVLLFGTGLVGLAGLRLRKRSRKIAIPTVNRL